MPLMEEDIAAVALEEDTVAAEQEADIAAADSEEDIVVGWEGGTAAGLEEDTAAAVVEAPIEAGTWAEQEVVKHIAAGTEPAALEEDSRPAVAAGEPGLEHSSRPWRDETLSRRCKRSSSEDGEKEISEVCGRLDRSLARWPGEQESKKRKSWIQARKKGANGLTLYTHGYDELVTIRGRWNRSKACWSFFQRPSHSIRIELQRLAQARRDRLDSVWTRGSLLVWTLRGRQDGGVGKEGWAQADRQLPLP